MSMMYSTADGPPRSGGRSQLRRFLVLVTLGSVLLTTLAVITTGSAAAQQELPDHRWFQIDAQVLRTENGPDRADATKYQDSYLRLIAEAKDYGYNGVVIRGAEINALGNNDQGRDAGWVASVRKITAAAEQAGLEVIMAFGSIGRCNPLLVPNGEQDLATAYPVNMAMRAANDVLVPAGTPTIESSLSGQQIVGDGSLKVGLSGLEVRGQYRIIITMDEADINVGRVTVQVVDRPTGQSLNLLKWAKPDNPGTPQISVAFNAFASSEVDVFLTAKNRNGATLRVTGYSVKAEPTLNGVSRDGKIGNAPALALDVIRNGRVDETLVLGNGIDLRDGNDRSVPRDPMLGTWDRNVNSWSAKHEPPVLRLTRGLAPYDGLRLRGWHALAFEKVVSCSWNDPKVSQLIGRIAVHARNLGATASLLPFDEINSGGAEPADGRGSNTSRAMTNSIANIVGAVRRAVGGAMPVYIYSDMVDRNTNARPCYVHVVGELNQPRSVPNGVTVLTWDTSGDGSRHFTRDDRTCRPTQQSPGFDIARHRAEGLKNISGLASSQIVAGYYDTDDVETDHTEWQKAIRDPRVDGVTGAFYATWEHPGKCPAYADASSEPLRCSNTQPCKDNLETRGCAFEHLEEFAELWWGDIDPGDPTNGELTVEVTGTSALAQWSFPDDPNVNGTWLMLDGDGKWYQNPITTKLYDDLSTGEHTIVAWATRGSGREPIKIGQVTFTIEVDDSAPLCDGRTPTIAGGPTDEKIVGTTGDDVIWAGAGDDIVYGAGGNDIICGGQGDDQVYAGPGDDLVHAGPGRDSVYGGSGDDELVGGDGIDHIWGGWGADQLIGGAQPDRLVGGPGNDDLLGGAGNDDLFGGPGDDRFNGGPGDGDSCQGNSGIDTHVGNCERLVDVP